MKISGVYKGKIGYTPIVSNTKKGLRLIRFGLLNLSRGKLFEEINKNFETVLVILNGKCKVGCEGKIWRMGRRNSVFESRAYALYVPPKCGYKITAISSEVEIAVCKSPAKTKTIPQLITPSQVRLRKVGRGCYIRYVYDIASDNVKAEKLMVGETINSPGNWSSYPPHKHNVDNLPYESKLEELYFFRLEPQDGFGVMRVYDNKKMNQIYVIKNNDVVTIPKGYHPVGVIPGYKIYYLWVLAGKKRIMKPRDDPAYAWVNREEK
ncbi:5-deoxy-glucuronate isomerase [Candidatus Desantisbacteria bacterium CG1_02_38_46]|uniref:5-deoxy-glucuronate isomerase n=3 Tax=unclassified Candidatus Desantisiibacteriota TaxID=3106372 RepID=A0A2H9PBH6_9BACT|nr:MAG: 5-deoxy-glucuronate isomerase [Candidatus Desantisbacteria bacterium CG1_02_38_46]PIU52070.1 MAG: 5-deoxy-glucuronate isomerase [Candidatus Desantisbacteria bacterium CG07_land_8_20_14_0_80_39_15]PIZ16138.1 MAG: 5-deoxy-glucuronate isomerase [Candidatus Desantisbacteria bacterium CG_4_10_14_0_8_um_filter_39_17]